MILFFGLSAIKDWRAANDSIFFFLRSLAALILIQYHLFIYLFLV